LATDGLKRPCQGGAIAKTGKAIKGGDADGAGGLGHGLDCVVRRRAEINQILAHAALRIVTPGLVPWPNGLAKGKIVVSAGG
jgi:hypothetical protein